MENFSVKEIVKDNKVKFSHYRAGHLYYRVVVNYIGYVFPVPIDDIGDATFLDEDKALIFMRYIRKALDEGSFVKSND
jgi:hypothetical protein